jgi:hypothetical protein
MEGKRPFCSKSTTQGSKMIAYKSHSVQKEFEGSLRLKKSTQRAISFKRIAITLKRTKLEGRYVQNGPARMAITFKRVHHYVQKSARRQLQKDLQKIRRVITFKKDQPWRVHTFKKVRFGTHFGRLKHSSFGLYILTRINRFIVYFRL